MTENTGREKTMKITAVGKRMFISFCFVAVIFAAIGGLSAAKAAEMPIAIKGYDTVAYFQDGRAIKGSESFTFPWNGMIWHFQSKENRDLFVASPEKYAPQYDGFCAWAMTEERKAITDPEVWKIIDGKLYLNCSQAAYEKWSRDIPGHIKKADAVWLKMRGGD
jgi:YHS domain-containing protein